MNYDKDYFTESSGFTLTKHSKETGFIWTDIPYKYGYEVVVPVVLKEDSLNGSE